MPRVRGRARAAVRGAVRGGRGGDRPSLGQRLVPEQRLMEGLGLGLRRHAQLAFQQFAAATVLLQGGLALA